MKLDFREIEREIRDFAERNRPKHSDFWQAPNGDYKADGINLTELAKHLTDFINQRGDKS